MSKKYFALAALLVSIGATATSNRIDIGNFSSNDLMGWENQSFAGHTQYSFANGDSGTVLQAVSDGSASGIGKRMKVDLNKTPYVNWSWKVEKGLPALNEKSKAGDDYAARLYVVKSGGALVWNTKAVNYVWSANAQRNENWPNAFRPKNAVMVAARGTSDKTGVWVHEKRNVKEDFKNLFGKNISSIDAIAIMTDTDNSGLSAQASYGDIYFTAE